MRRTRINIGRKRVLFLLGLAAFVCTASIPLTVWAATKTKDVHDVMTSTIDLVPPACSEGPETEVDQIDSHFQAWDNGKFDTRVITDGVILDSTTGAKLGMHKDIFHFVGNTDDLPMITQSHFVITCEKQGKVDKGHFVMVVDGQGKTHVHV